MNIDEFVGEFIDGYIASDLDTMSKSARAAGLPHGDVGYPMVLTTLAGIELLGGLLLPMGTRFTTSNGRSHFLRFWDDYLAKDFPVYVGFGELFYNLLRSGIAHTFTAKQGVYVTKGSGTPLRYDVASLRVFVDSNMFAEDFLSTYRKNFVPLLSIVDAAVDPNANSMQAHLDQMTGLYELNSKSEFKNLVPSQESLDNAKRHVTVTSFSPIKGMSGPVGDLPAKRLPTISGMPTPDA